MTQGKLLAQVTTDFSLLNLVERVGLLVVALIPLDLEFLFPQACASPLQP